MFNQPGTASGDKLELEALTGRLLLIYPKEHKTVPTQAFGDKDCLVADIVVLDGPSAGERLHDSFIFPGFMIGQLKQYIGNPNPALGRVAKGQGKPGQQAPWILADFTDQDAQIATAWVNANPRGFNSPAPQQHQQTTIAPGHQIDHQAAAAAQALEQQRQAAAAQQATVQPYAAGGYVNTGTGEITPTPAPAAAAAPAPGAPQINVDTIRTLLSLAVPDQDIANNTGATLEQINAIRNLPA
jgi:hypothetical protein